jgi:hypothetical protein
LIVHDRHAEGRARSLASEKQKQAGFE